MKRLAIITGATSGIGYELSKIIANEDLDIILISRSIENLEKVKEELSEYNKNNIQIFPYDLSKDGYYDKLIELINGRNIKYLINNAGFGDYGEFINSSIDKQKKMIDLNIKSLTELSYMFLNETKNNNEKTYLLNVASVAAFTPGPLMSVYYATKAYVVNFTRAIEYENKNKNILISILCPGPTSTNFVKSSNLENSNFFDKLKVMTPKQVAEISYKKLNNDKTTIIPGLLNRLMIYAVKFAPYKLLNYFAYKVMESKEKNK